MKNFLKTLWWKVKKYFLEDRPEESLFEKNYSEFMRKNHFGDNDRR